LFDELVFTVSGDRAAPAAPIALAEAGLTERKHLQEWVLAHPAILGQGVKPVTMEFDRWIDSGGQRDLHRLDVMGLDQEGYLVVAELKRGRAEHLTDLQAVQYAAMASRFTVGRLAEHHAAFLTKTEGRAYTKDEATDLLLDWAPDLSDETLRTPRILLIAADFASNVSNTAVFLNDVGLTVALVRFQAYRTPAGETLVTFSQLYPVPEIDEFTVVPRGVEQRQRQQALRQRSKPTVTRLIDAGAMSEGEELHFDPSFALNEEMRDNLKRWLAAEPDAGMATWQDQRSAPLVWRRDGNAYAPTPLALKIIEEATGDAPTATQGPRWWRNGDGQDLVWKLPGSGVVGGPLTW
jgi:hypothetical protein